MSKDLAIVGAGVAGRALARCLSQRRIPYTVYEQKSQSQSNNYGILLEPLSYGPLAQALGVGEDEFRRQVAVEIPSGQPGSLRASGITNWQDGTFRAHRAKLEQFLIEGIGDRIKWEKRVAAIDIVEDSGPGKASLKLRFDDGVEAHHAGLIAADGVHSAIRSLMAESDPEVLPYVAITGTKRIAKTTYEDCYAAYFEDTSTVHTLSDNVFLRLDVDDINADRVSMRWIYSRKAKGEADPLYQPNRSTDDAKDIPDEFFQELKRLEPLDEPFRMALNPKELENDRKLSWLMRVTEMPSQILEHLASKNTCFIGDAAHAQPILGGKGANAAIDDAVQLSEHIATKGIESLSSWPAMKVDEWHRGIAASKASINRMHMAARSSM